MSEEDEDKDRNTASPSSLQMQDVKERLWRVREEEEEEIIKHNTAPPPLFFVMDVKVVFENEGAVNEEGVPEEEEKVMRERE